MEIEKILARQATRTIAKRQIRKAAKNLPINPMIKHVGLAAIISAVSYLVTKKM